MGDEFDDISPSTKENLNQALSQARLYFDAFVTNPAGAELLKQWTERDFYEPVAVNAPHTQYAAVEARRAFIRGIHTQIGLAKSGGR
jgi:hypothetical protein